MQPQPEVLRLESLIIISLAREARHWLRLRLRLEERWWVVVKRAAPSQDLVSPGAAPMYAGGGAGFFMSNAGTPGAIGGHFATDTVDTPVVSVQFSKGGGIWSLSVTFGPGGLFGASVMTTNTVTKTVAGPGTCVGK